MPTSEYCYNVKSLLNPGMVISVASSPDVLCDPPFPVSLLVVRSRKVAVISTVVTLITYIFVDQLEIIVGKRERANLVLGLGRFFKYGRCSTQSDWLI